MGRPRLSPLWPADWCRAALVVDPEVQVDCFTLAGQCQAVLTRLYVRKRRLVFERLSAGANSWTQDSLLSTLFDEGPMRMGDLALAVHVTTGSLTTLVQRLEKREFVRRRRDDVDERTVFLEITSAGAAALEESMSSSKAELSELIEALARGEQLLLKRVMPALVRLISMVSGPSSETQQRRRP